MPKLKFGFELKFELKITVIGSFGRHLLFFRRNFPYPIVYRVPGTALRRR
jgi:hypothetical protein